MGQPPPPVNFPLFTGENPQLWKTLCEQYFQMFSIPDSYRVPMETLNFSGPAGIWLQSVQKKLVGLDWEAFASLLCTRFGRDKHQMLIRQFYAIKQTTFVADFIERFESLMNHLISYSESTHLYFFLTRFVEGLRPDICAVVLIQRPPDLDTACSLALLQEEVADGEPCYGRFPHVNRGQGQASRTASPPFLGRPATPTANSEDRRGTDAARATSEVSKVAALCAFRRAKGLCFKCGEKWGKDHVCPPTVQMHIVDELLAMFSIDEASSESPPDSPISDEENLCTLSWQAEDGTSAPGVLQLQAWVQGHEVLLLVDSGSSTSFVDSSFASKLSGTTLLARPCRVRVADGATIPCTHYIPDCSWIAHEHEFKIDFKLIKLGSYDAILGMDSLRKHNPMNIDWIEQHLTVTTPSGQLKMSAVSSDQTQCSLISALELLKACKQGSVAHVIHLNSLDGSSTTDAPIPTEVLRLLEQFTDVFEDPRSLPPRRECDHRIPLMAGAQPVNLRPYRYKPELKTEIERQVQELLDAGVIQKSSSPFSSPALLVKKKDGSWRLCVDY
ncbi:uncharacterized protein [Aegilops tauschii subsp. strangulata]|uniref:uncharacterized protein n=1 Tax=Aegilops tauschii subsp. strangulata TaxID=200361 RepID=UPI003CC8B65C